MTDTHLANLAHTLEYDEMPQTWKIADPARFSKGKTLFEYQQNALKNAAKTLRHFYRDVPADVGGNPVADQRWRKNEFAMVMHRQGMPLPPIPAFLDRRRSKPNPIFHIYEPFFTPSEGMIKRQHILNRMGFWMATGSGKTLIIVKLLAHLQQLKRHRHVPSHPCLVLAPSDHALQHIIATAADYNAAGKGRLNFRHLREFNAAASDFAFAGESTVYYCRSDHLSHERKKALLNWRDYDNNGDWFVFLDEAHKGGRDDSKRKAYYSLMARNGFLFNFSATFDEAEDIHTTVFRYNLSDFTRDGRGKNILLAEKSFRQDRYGELTADITEESRADIVLESLMALAAARAGADGLRAACGRADAYHAPMMLTLVNSVNTDGPKNDLFAFFKMLRDIASGDIAQERFNAIKKALQQQWQKGNRLFADNGNEENKRGKCAALANMTIAKFRRHVFSATGQGAIEWAESGGQIALKLKSADRPFALIKIGSIAKWTKDFLAGMEHVAALDRGGWFANLDDLPHLSILMGSRAFFESWDSVRPNVINFINIGSANATIFVPQAIGRGVRVAPLPGQRRRLQQLLPNLPAADKAAMQKITAGEEEIAETLLIYATNAQAIQKILDGMRGLRQDDYVPLGEGLFKVQSSAKLPLLVPQYKKAAKGAAPKKLRLAPAALDRLRLFSNQASDELLMLAYRLTGAQLKYMRAVANGDMAETKDDYGNYGIAALLNIIREKIGDHSGIADLSDGVRELNAEDIVHFRKMEARMNPTELESLRQKIAQVRESGERGAYQYRDQPPLDIRHCANHYYVPIITARADAIIRADYIRTIIDEPSEVRFVDALEQWLQNGGAPDWQRWMFCKLNEHRDEVYIPYRPQNHALKFKPDFIFWMKNGNDYHIVFVDPKGTTHVDYQYKIDDYKKLFEDNGAPRVFAAGKHRVSVRLLMYNPTAPRQPEAYVRFWTSAVQDIFHP